MANESIEKLYNGVSKHYNIGDLETFKEKMLDADSRKRFYDQVSQRLDIGTFDVFEQKISTKPMFQENRFSLSAPPDKMLSPGVHRTEHSKPIPGIPFGQEKFLLSTPAGRIKLKQYGYEVVAPKEPLTAKEIARAQNKLFLEKEIGKEIEKGLDQRSAVRKVYSDIGGEPPNIVDMGMANSVTGSLFRSLGLEGKDLSQYPPNKLEELASGALSMVMPVDAWLFSTGGSIGSSQGIKLLGKYGDEVAKIISKRGKISLDQAKKAVVGAIGRITGGAGGFAAYDSGRSVFEQIEHKGSVNPLIVAKEMMKGAAIGGTVGTFGLIGSKFGKPAEFVAEVFGLGTVPPLMEGEELTFEGYAKAAGTILGIKFLNTMTHASRYELVKSVAKELETQVKKTGKPLDEVANKHGKELQSAVELAIEGKTPEKQPFQKSPKVLGEEPTPGKIELLDPKAPKIPVEEVKPAEPKPVEPKPVEPKPVEKPVVEPKEVKKVQEKPKVDPPKDFQSLDGNEKRIGVKFETDRFKDKDILDPPKRIIDVQSDLYEGNKLKPINEIKKIIEKNPEKAQEYKDAIEHYIQSHIGELVETYRYESIQEGKSFEKPLTEYWDFAQKIPTDRMHPGKPTPESKQKQIELEEKPKVEPPKEVKESWEMTFDEFSESNIKKDINPVFVQDAWVHHIEKALKDGKDVSKNVLDSHKELRFENGKAVYRKPTEPKPKVEPPKEVDAGDYQPLQAPKYVKDFLLDRNSSTTINESGSIGFTQSKTSVALIGKLIKQGYVEKTANNSYQLTEKGRKSKKQIAENERIEKDDGVSMQHYPQKKVNKDPLREGVSGHGIDVMVNKMDGEPAYSNGHYLIKGKPRPETPIADRSPSFDSVIPKSSFSDPVAKPVGWYIQGGLKRVVISDGSKGAVVDGQYYDFIKTKFPKSDFRLTTEKQADILINKVSIYSNGKRVGLLMPIKVEAAEAPSRFANVLKPKESKKLKPVSSLTGDKKARALELQKQLVDLDHTIKKNKNSLKNKSNTPIQKEKIKESISKAEELRKDVKEQAESKGIELQVFTGIPSLRLLRQVFGKKTKPKTIREKELDRLYANAMERLGEGDKKEVTNVKSVKPTNIVSEVIGDIINVSTDMANRVGRSNTPTSKEAERLANKAVDTQKKIHGQISQILDETLRISNKGKAVKDLQRFIEVTVDGNTVIMPRLIAAIEGYINVSGKELVVVEKQRDLIEKRGKLFEENIIMQLGKDGEVKPFKVYGRNIAPRIMTGQFYSIISKGSSSPHWSKLINEFSKVSKEPREAIEKRFETLREQLIGDMPEAHIRSTQAEFSREWKHIPMAIQSGGELIPLVEYRPYQYAKRLAETGEARIGVATTFGQEVDNTSIVGKLKKQIAKEGGDPKLFHQMMRSLSGAPVEAPFMDAGSSKAKLYRSWRGFESLAKQLSLSLTAAPNITEFMGNLSRHGGSKSMIKSFGQMAKNPVMLQKTLETLGAVTVDIADLSVDPNRPISSRVKAVNESLRRGFLHKFINEGQEIYGAALALNKVEMFKKGQGTGRDEILIREMGFSRKEAELIVSGKAPEELNNAMIRKASAHLTGGAAKPAELSRIEHSKVMRTLFPFQTYAHMKIRHLGKVLGTNQKVIKEAIAEKDFKKLSDSARLVTRDFVGTAMAGVWTQFFLAALYGGKDELVIKWHEVKKHPLAFIVNSWAYTQFGGVYGAIIQSTGGGRNPLETIYPYVLGKELIDATQGKGRYSYLDYSEKMMAFVSRFAPINKVTRNFAVAFGLGNKQSHKTDIAKRHYWQWRFNNDLQGSYSRIPDEEIKHFRTHMKKAYNAIQSGEDWKIIDKHMIESLKGTDKDKTSIQRSLLGKRLLTKNNIAPGKSEEIFEERKNDLKETIGQNAYKRLEDHDELLEIWSKSF